uniref:Spermatophylax protein 1e n=1 Tax=Gryllodes sigillatus TaxID=13551 RepID=A0A0P0ALI4_9ORTH|nr:spermatophylax protein 1e [Gryllodes sigillatus]
MRCVAVLAMLLVVLLGAEAAPPEPSFGLLGHLADKAWDTAVGVGDQIVDKASDVADTVLGASGSKQQAAPSIIYAQPGPVLVRRARTNMF